MAVLVIFGGQKLDNYSPNAVPPTKTKRGTHVQETRGILHNGSCTTAPDLKKEKLVGGWTNPSWKISAIQIGSFPQVGRGENKYTLED